MGVKVGLRTRQINQIASSISLKEASDYAKAHPKEYELFLQQEEQQKKTEENNFTNNKCTMWFFYTDDTICKVKLDNKNGGITQ